jgi:hypothetical protein
MAQNQIDELKSIRKNSVKKIGDKISKINKILSDDCEIQVSDTDVTAFEESREQIRIKKLKYVNQQ